MSRPDTTQVPDRRAGWVTDVALGLAAVAMVVMVAEFFVDRTRNGSGFLGLTQLVLTVVCLTIGLIYVFGSDDAADPPDDAGPVVIDLREAEPGPAEPPVTPRQLPDARAANIFPY